MSIGLVISDFLKSHKYPTSALMISYSSCGCVSNLVLTFSNASMFSERDVSSSCLIGGKSWKKFYWYDHNISNLKGEKPLLLKDNSYFLFMQVLQC